MNAEEFYQVAQHPDFADQFVLEIEHSDPDPERTFSMEAIEDLTQKASTFVAARIFGRWQKTNEPPKKIRVTIAVDWDWKEPIEESWFPWVKGETDDAGMTMLDGKHRKPVDK
jgi:hypothetical protein